MVIQSNDCNADYIAGFDLEWGYFYTLKIKIHQLKIPPTDGLEKEYTLVKTIPKTKVPQNYEYKMMLTRDLYLGLGEQSNNFKRINDSTFTYFDKIEIEVAPILRNEFYKIVNEGPVC